MLDILEFAIQFLWTSMRTHLEDRVLHIRYEASTAFTMTLVDSELLILDDADPQWCDFELSIHSSDFRVPRLHELRGMIQYTP